MKIILILLSLSLTSCVIRTYHETKCYPAGEREMLHCSSTGVCDRYVVPIYRCY